MAPGIYLYGKYFSYGCGRATAAAAAAAAKEEDVQLPTCCSSRRLLENDKMANNA